MVEQNKIKLTERGEVKNHSFKGVDRAKRMLRYMQDVIVYFDPDVDGCVSGWLACSLLSKMGIRYQWYINAYRSHDWTLPLEKVSGRDIIAVDFIITPEKLMELCDAGCNVISIDHHVNRKQAIEYSSDYGTEGVIINNQYDEEDSDSRYLSGAGVVFEAFIEMFPEFDTELNRSLVGMTLLSDIRDIENPLAEGYLYKLYIQRYKGYIKYLIENTIGDKDYGFGLPRMDRNYVDFKFSPAINACLRFNRHDHVVKFFLGSHMLDLSCRGTQKELLKKANSLLKRIDYSNLRVCYFFENDFIEYGDVLSCFVGLIASKNLDGKRSVICYMISDEGGGKYIKRASFRGNINGIDYQSALGGLFECVGHKSAFGIKGLRANKETFMKANSICRLLEEKTNYTKKVIEVPNLAMFNSKKLAEDNMYCLSQNRTYIKYIGNVIKNKRGGGGFMEYSVNGIPVMCFDNSVDFENGLVLPILDRGIPTFYLE